MGFQKIAEEAKTLEQQKEKNDQREKRSEILAPCTGTLLRIYLAASSNNQKKHDLTEVPLTFSTR